MYCSNCGQANDNNAYKCVACGDVLQGPSSSPPMATPMATPMPPPLPAPPSAGQRPHVPNHLVWAILATLFCCLPSGIVAIVYAAQVDGKVAAGDVTGAQAAARNAAKWCWVSAGVGVLVGILYFFVVLGSLAAHH